MIMMDFMLPCDAQRCPSSIVYILVSPLLDLHLAVNLVHIDTTTLPGTGSRITNHDFPSLTFWRHHGTMSMVHASSTVLSQQDATFPSMEFFGRPLSPRWRTSDFTSLFCKEATRRPRSKIDSQNISKRFLTGVFASTSDNQNHPRVKN
jgi:hypothetical protein